MTRPQDVVTKPVATHQKSYTENYLRSFWRETESTFHHVLKSNIDKTFPRYELLPLSYSEPNKVGGLLLSIIATLDTADMTITQEGVVSDINDCPGYTKELFLRTVK